MELVTQVGDAKILRGPRLGENMIAWNNLQIFGVKTVLNLERGYFEWFHGELNQETVLSSIHELTPIHLQLGDIVPPTPTELYTALNLVNKAVKAGGGVYIHCLHGVDRTGLVCAMLRRHWNKWTPDECIKEMYDKGFHKFPYEALGWVNRLRDCLR